MKRNLALRYDTEAQLIRMSDYAKLIGPTRAMWAMWAMWASTGTRVYSLKTNVSEIKIYKANFRNVKQWPKT